MSKYRIQVLTGIGFYWNGQPIPAVAEVDARTEIRAYTVGRFNGVTLREQEGAWTDKEGFVIAEQGLTIEVIADDPFKDNPDVSEARRLSAIHDQGKALARFVRSVLQQNSVVLIVDKPEVAEFIDH